MHEIPGGQYTNLLFQATQLGLEDKWSEIKRKYAQANLLMGDIPKVTPSSKVVGDMAQFMVSQQLEPEDVIAQAESLSFPDSVVQYFQGAIGQPPGGFPEPLRSKIIKGRTLADGKPFYEGRPGVDLAPFDFEKARAKLGELYKGEIDDKDVLSYALYPQVYAEWQDFRAAYGDVAYLQTHLFLNPMREGDEVELEIAEGRSFLLKLVSMPEPDAEGIRNMIFEVNGERWFLPVSDASVQGTSTVREKVKSGDVGAVGAPMPGVVVDIKVKDGDKVEEGEPLVVLSAMKMETMIQASTSGTISRLICNVGDKVDADDLLIKIDP